MFEEVFHVMKPHLQCCISFHCLKSVTYFEAPSVECLNSYLRGLTHFLTGRHIFPLDFIVPFPVSCENVLYSLEEVKRNSVSSVPDHTRVMDPEASYPDVRLRAGAENLLQNIPAVATGLPDYKDISDDWLGDDSEDDDEEEGEEGRGGSRDRRRRQRESKESTRITEKESGSGSGCALG
eukprot:g173.t1